MKNIFKTVVVTILTAEARLLLKRARPRIIAITGSVGKTSTKDAVYHAIKNTISARKSEKSYNSEIGVPLSILGLDNAWQNPFLWLRNIASGFLHALLPFHYPKVLVLEMGVDRPGDMKRLTSWIKPDIVILTRLPDVPVHVEYFSSPEEVAAEKLTLVAALAPDGILIYNHDDEKVRQAALNIHQKSVGYSRYSPSDYTVSEDKIIYENGLPKGVEFTISHSDQSAKFSLSGAVGVSNLYNFAAAAAAAGELGVGLEAAAAEMANFVPPPGRLRLVPGIKNTLIIDDTYNSSPVAVLSALSTLNEINGFNRKIAVLGDMLELGRFSTEAHEQVGAQAAECSDVLITVGVRARQIASGALNSGMSEKNILQYDETARAGKGLQNLIQPGDLILIKGSQGLRMERIVLEVMNEPEKAGELLVRQSKAWQEIS
ncbi:MAG: UDP-N-acetylmuramoyl-tripeptide--D-alanyl-D-alanine ligase [Candidatus Paceibacterota bacterium]